MIFDERDLEEEPNEEKDNFKPAKNQMKIDDLCRLVKPAKQAKSTKKSKEEAEEETKKKKKVDVKSLQLDLNTIDEEVNEESEQEHEEEVAEKREEKRRQNVMDRDGEGNFIKSIDQVLHDAMIPYSEYVIMDRALPRVEDGLKPVQRRILYSMYELGLYPEKPFKKSAKVVGDVIANYHPHGDSSVYNALVRLAQKFNMREILVDGHGNFGSEDGDGAAAMRYTEAKLAPLALELVRDIEKNTVRWSKNYDDSKDEPDMLPSRFPNLLVNGANGIAVGLATNIPTHNLAECLDGCIALIDNPAIELKDMMKIIKGPDFPTGGIILGADNIEEAYRTGKAKIIIRSKTHIEEEGDKKTIVVDEFPFQTNKALALQKIVELKEKYKDILGGIGEIRDESDRMGTRAVICLKKDVNAENVLKFLFKYSDLQVTYGINMVAIANAKPVQLGLLDILKYYVDYQRNIIVNRTKFDLDAAKERAHILQGLLIAINNIDAVVKIIKKSESTADAKQKLMAKFFLSDRQAQAILDMRLARLAHLEVYKIEEELAQLEALIKKLTEILNSRKLQMNIIKEEMLEIKKKYGNPRKTKIIEDASNMLIEDDLIEKPAIDVVVAYNARNGIKKMTEKNFLANAKSLVDNSTLSEAHSILVRTKTGRILYLFTNIGKCYRVPVDDISDGRWREKGMILTEAIPVFHPDEKVVGIFDSTEVANDELFFVTSKGTVRLTKAEDFNIKKAIFPAFNLDEDETLINVERFNPNKSMLFITKDGISLNAETSDIPHQSKGASGVKGINLNEGDRVVYCELVDEKQDVVVVTDKGYAKKVKVSEIGLLARNRKGVKVITLQDNGTAVKLAKAIVHTFEVALVDKSDKLYSMKSDSIALENRTTKGKLPTKYKTLKIKDVILYLWKPE